jgi:hypothetical protein
MKIVTLAILLISPILGLALLLTAEEPKVILPADPVLVLDDSRELKCHTLASEQQDGAPLTAYMTRNLKGYVVISKERWDALQRK